MRKKLFFLVLMSTALLACNIFSQVPPGEVGNVENVSTDDSEMNAAIQQAQNTLPLFIEAFQSPKSTQSYFSIKARFPYGTGDDAEHMWIDDLSFNENQFEGIVSNEPVYVHDIQVGDRITVEIADVTDWMIVDDDLLLGGFTIHVLRNRMTTSEREEFDRDFGLIIPDEPALP